MCVSVFRVSRHLDVSVLKIQMHWRHKDRFWTFRTTLIVDGCNEGNIRKLKLISILACAFGSKVIN